MYSVHEVLVIVSSLSPHAKRNDSSWQVAHRVAGKPGGGLGRLLERS